jgi:hypothetical protein
VPHEQPTGAGELAAAASPGDQRQAEVALEALHVLAHRGLGPPEGPRGGGQRPAATDLAEDEQASRVDAHAQIKAQL